MLFISGDSCEVDKNNGICKHIRNCPVALENWRQREIFPTFCDTVTRIVCCQVTQQSSQIFFSPPRSISARSITSTFCFVI